MKTESQERPLPGLRSTWGSVGDLRDALPNRGLSTSELDLRLAHRREEERQIAAETLRQNRSFSFSDNVKEFFGKKNVSENLSSEDVQTSVKMSSSPLLRLRALSKSLDFSRLIASKLKPSVSKSLVNQREFRASLPSICITPSASDAEYSPFLSRKLGSILGNVENFGVNESLNFSTNPGGQKKEIEEEEKKIGKHQSRGVEEKEDVMYQRGVGIAAGTPQTSLKGLPAMDMQLRDGTSVFEGVMNTEVQNEGSSCK